MQVQPFFIKIWFLDDPIVNLGLKVNIFIIWAGPTVGSFANKMPCLAIFAINIQKERRNWKTGFFKNMENGYARFHVCLTVYTALKNQAKKSEKK